MDNRVDPLVFLLSSDWFEPEWALIGVAAGHEQRKQLQAQCRLLVSDVIASADSYWDSNFSSERIQITQQRFRNSVLNTIDLPEDRDRLFILAGLSNEASDFEIDLGLVANIFRLAQSESTDSEIRQSMPPALVDFLHLFDSENKLIDVLSKRFNERKSTWDEFLIRATPGHDEYLLDFAIEFGAETDFDTQVWARLSAQLKPDAIESTVLWVNRWSNFLANRSAILR